MKEPLDLIRLVEIIRDTLIYCLALHGATPEQRADIISALGGAPR
jgi:hypothetical protein